MSAIGKISVLPHQIDLWCCFTDSISDDDLHLYRQSLLSPEEHERASHFYFERDRKKFFITRALVRSVLSRYAALAPAAWEFVAGSHGRPQVVQDVAQHLCFNLSHTAGLVVMTVSADQDMGWTRKILPSICVAVFSAVDGYDHLLSVCAQQEQPLHLRVHHCRPLLDETMLRATLLRQTRIEASICADSPFS